MLKKLLLSIFISSVTFLSNAQINKGTILLGGDLNFSSQQYETSSLPGTNKSNGFYISPVFAKAIKTNTFFGGSVFYGQNRLISSNNSVLQSYTYGAGVFMRKYKVIFKTLYAFLQSGINANGGKSNLLSNGLSYGKTFSASLSMTPGLSIGISKKVFLETGFSNVALLRYTRLKSVDNNRIPAETSVNRQIDFSSSLSGSTSNLYFGFRVMLPKKN